VSGAANKRVSCGFSRSVCACVRENVAHSLFRGPHPGSLRWNLSLTNDKFSKTEFSSKAKKKYSNFQLNLHNQYSVAVGMSSRVVRTTLPTIKCRLVNRYYTRPHEDLCIHRRSSFQEFPSQFRIHVPSFWISLPKMAQMSRNISENTENNGLDVVVTVDFTKNATYIQTIHTPYCYTTNTYILFK